MKDVKWRGSKPIAGGKEILGSSATFTFKYSLQTTGELQIRHIGSKSTSMQQYVNLAFEMSRRRKCRHSVTSGRSGRLNSLFQLTAKMFSFS